MSEKVKSVKAAVTKKQFKSQQVLVQYTRVGCNHEIYADVWLITP